jgi:hypothetical protein
MFFPAVMRRVLQCLRHHHSGSVLFAQTPYFVCSWWRNSGNSDCSSQTDFSVGLVLDASVQASHVGDVMWVHIAISVLTKVNMWCVRHELHWKYKYHIKYTISWNSRTSCSSKHCMSTLTSVMFNNVIIHHYILGVWVQAPQRNAFPTCTFSRL